jgi:hypothetical protein
MQDGGLQRIAIARRNSFFQQEGSGDGTLV